MLCTSWSAGVDWLKCNWRPRTTTWPMISTISAAIPTATTVPIHQPSRRALVCNESNQASVAQYTVKLIRNLSGFIQIA